MTQLPEPPEACQVLEDIEHLYLSTACFHGLHEECQTNATRYDGTVKKAASCKFCGAPCWCTCHLSKIS